MAEKTLSSVQGIESAVNSSEDIRREVLSVHQQTDEMITRINNITQTVRIPMSLPCIVSCKTTSWCFTLNLRQLVLSGVRANGVFCENADTWPQKHVALGK